MKKLLTTLFLLCACAQAQAQIVGTLPFQLQNGTTADATQVMADFNKILNDVNINAAKNGVNTDITALNALVTPITPVQGGTTIYYASTSGGTANAQTVATPTPSGFTLAVGKRVTFIAGFTNTGAMTLNVNSTGATAVNRMTPSGPIALVGGEVVANNYVEAVYDGTRFVLYTRAATVGYGPQVSTASAGTVDIGAVAVNHNVLITGTTTITSFGSSAVTTYPIYVVKFDNVLTLTHNGTSLILPGSVNITTAANDNLVALYLGSGNWQVMSYNRATGRNVATLAPTHCIILTTAAVTCSGGTSQANNGTYTPSANVLYMRVRMVGGGGGGGGSGSGAGSGGTGGNTTFSTFTANGGGGGSGASGTSNAGGAGGSVSGCALNLPGAPGNGAISTAAAQNMGAAGGGSSFFGGAGAMVNGGQSASTTNTGGGGGGGSFAGATASGAGGGGGGSCEGWINAPSGTYSYAIGAAGTAGTVGSGGNAGGAGGSGVIIVDEYYN